MVRRYLDFLLIFAAGDTDQTRVVGIVGEALAVTGERIDEAAERRRDCPLVCQPAEHGALTASGTGTTFRHVGRLVPAQHIGGRIQIADLA